MKLQYLSGNLCLGVGLWKYSENYFKTMNEAGEKYKNLPIFIDTETHNLLILINNHVIIKLSEAAFP